MKIKDILIITGILFLIIAISCEELPCDDSDGVQINLGFYYLKGSYLSDTTFDSLIVSYINSDEGSYYIDSINDEVDTLSFPLSKLSDTSAVIITFKDAVSDTLIFSYDRTLALENHKCGFDVFFELNKVTTTKNKIDSIWIRKDLVEYGNSENVKIYF